jgi:hypothetical protein
LQAAGELIRRSADLVAGLQALLRTSGPVLTYGHQLTELERDVERLAEDVMVAQLTPVHETARIA